ncbi:MAG TPA: MaoC family dehydratase [Chloroflexota bacterium]|nr:MaoC family dehydratase [Chloroflexota bacterium]
MDLRQVQAGFAFPLQTLILDQATAAAYVEAVEDPSPFYRAPDAVVPPLAILALSMRGLTDLLVRYPGATHASQRLTMARPARMGDTVTAALTVRTRSERRGFAALILEIRVEDGSDAVLEGEMLLMVPLGEGSAAHG